MNRSPKNPSASQYVFANNPSIAVPRCSIVRPFTHKTTIDAGYLYPLYCEEVLPGDTFTVDSSFIARLSTPVVPIMDNLYLDAQFFFVPYRLVWKHFTNMHGEQQNPTDPISFTMPQLTCPPGGVAVGSIHDYLGLPTGVQWRQGDVHSLVHRAYNLIWNQWYRDENLQNEVDVPLDDDADSSNDFHLLRRNKRKDYFTSSLPWPQKGDAVTLPLTGSAPVVGTGKVMGLTGFGTGSDNDSRHYLVGTSFPSSVGYTQQFAYVGGSTGTLASPMPNVGAVSGSGANPIPGSPTDRSYYGIGLSTHPETSGVVADLSGVSSFTINDLRTAFQVQKLLERSARGGTRYTELLYSMFGVTNPDLRLQRPELLGTWSLPVSINSVAQTSATDDTGDTPQGNLAGAGAAVGRRHCFSKSFSEYGVIIGLFSVRADLTYQQGIPRMYSRQGRYDFYYPAFAHLGEQAIRMKEIYCSGTSSDDDVFGYQERWSEYKYSVNRVSGQLRSSYAQTLDYWHLAQYFENAPRLSSEFVQENPPVSRCLSVTDAPQFVVDSYFNQRCVRPMPLYCTPGLIDHF